MSWVLANSRRSPDKRRLRRDSPVARVAEIPVLGWPEGPGFWLVLRHADVESVMTRPGLFSSWLGATQILDGVIAGWGALPLVGTAEQAVRQSDYRSLMRTQ